MEETQSTPLFGLSIEPVTKMHLSETAKWARFLAIMGFIGMGLIVIVFIFAGVFFGAMSSSVPVNRELRTTTGLAASMQFIFLILMVVLYFFPTLFLFRFATRMKAALAADDQEALNTSFQNLKKLFRFIGILTIIFISLYAIVIFAALLGGSLYR